MAETPALCHRRDLLAAGALTALAATAPALAATGSNRLAALAAHADQLVREQDYSGVLLIAEAGHIRLRRSWGQRQRAEALPNTLETRFNIASIGNGCSSMRHWPLPGPIARPAISPTASRWRSCCRTPPASAMRCGRCHRPSGNMSGGKPICIA